MQHNLAQFIMESSSAHYYSQTQLQLNQLHIWTKIAGKETSMKQLQSLKLMRSRQVRIRAGKQDSQQEEDWPQRNHKEHGTTQRSKRGTDIQPKAKSCCFTN